MTNKEILQKAIEKAVDNGWDEGKHLDGAFHLIYTSAEGSVIFNHSFAKAFWKPEKNELPMWDYHLQQMVIEEEPLKYLEQFL